MRAAPAGFAPNGLPLRYGAPEKLKAKRRRSNKHKQQATSGKRQAELMVEQCSVAVWKLSQLGQCYRAQRAPTPTTR
ncbi:hypothetical protein Xcc1_22860 [Xanthomonas campestris pv. campestris]|nr:hypothetical protein Xcc1_22860 [Xanthomonas campestris pv. campestris]